MLAVERGLGSGDVRADGVRDTGDAEAEEGRLRPVDPQRKFGAPLVAAHLGVGDARRFVHQVLGRVGEVLRVVQVVAADLERQAAAAVVVPAREEAVELVVPARRVGADDDARDVRELPAQVLGDLIARSRALVLRGQQDLHLAAVGAAATAAAAAAGIDDHRGRLRDELVDLLLEPGEHGVGALDARAERQLRAHADLAFVGLRTELGGNRRQDEDRRHHRRQRQADHGRPVRQGEVQEAPVTLVHGREEVFAGRVQAAAQALALVGRRGQDEQLRAQDRHQRHGHEQRHRQREDDDDRQLAEHDARQAAEEEQRHEHRDVREDRGQNRGPHLLTAVDRRRSSGPCGTPPCAGTSSRARRSRRRRPCRRRVRALRTSSCSA